MNRFLLLAGLLFAAPALAQTPTRVGPLSVQNRLGEIASDGTGAQATARANLGLSGVPLTVPTSPLLGGAPGAFVPLGIGAGLTGAGSQLSVVYGTGANTALQGSLRGVANGVAGLDAGGMVPLAQLPSLSALGAAATANNLSDLANASTARANLGLGTIATQSAGAVAITGGTIAATAISGSTGAFSTLSATGNATFSGTLGVTGFTTIGSNTNGNTFLFLNGASTSQKGIRLQTAGVERWRLSTLNNETGINNSGQDLTLQRFTDAGSGSVLATIFRSTGQLIYNSYATISYHSTTDNDPNPSFVASVNKDSGRGGVVGSRGLATNVGYIYTSVPDWTTTTSYTIGAATMVGGYNIIVATSSGTSGGVTPTCSTTVPTCSDGGVSWKYEARRGIAYQLVGATAKGDLSVGMGGTSTGAQGLAYGHNPVCTNEVQYTLGCIGTEIDVGLSFPALRRVGEQMVGTLAGAGTIDDVAWRLGINPGVPGFRHIFDWGTRSSQTVIDPNGYGVRAWSEGTGDPLAPAPTNMIGAGALDLTEFQPTGVGEFGGGFILRGPGSQILGSGDFQSNFALLHQTATGASLDVSQYHVTGVAVHAGGGGTKWFGGLLADCTDGTVVRITSVGGGAVLGVSVWIGAYGNAPIATVTCTSEQLVAPLDDAGNPTLPDTIQVDETWALANSGSPVLALGGVASVTAQTASVGDNSTLIATTAYVQGQASATTPLAAGIAAIGVGTTWARADHVHPTDTTRAPIANPTFTGVVTIPVGASIAGFAPLASPSLTGTPASITPSIDTNTTQIATTAFVLAQAAAATPLIDGTATVGTSTRYARADHVHPTDTTRAALSGATFTGGVNVGNNTTQQTFAINGPAASNRLMLFQTAGAKRFQFYINNAAEGGANAGSDVLFTAWDDPGTTAIFTVWSAVRSTGVMTIPNVNITGGAINATTQYNVGGTKVVSARATGWAAMTGTPDLASSFATSTVTLAQLAGRVMSLQAALTTHGLIGP